MASLPLVSVIDPDEPSAIRVCTDVEIDGETMRLVVDTGAGSSAFAAIEPIADLDVVGSGTGLSATGTAASDDLVIVPLLSLGPIAHRFGPPRRRPYRTRVRRSRSSTSPSPTLIRTCSRSPAEPRVSTPPARASRAGRRP